MTLAFIKQINEYVIDAIMEASDEEILKGVGDNGCPSQEDIHHAQKMIGQAVKERRQYTLAQKKAAFHAYKQEQKYIQIAPIKRPVSGMLSDIVAAMQNKDKVPKGIILAFREQGQDGSEDDIMEIWQNLVELGLIDPNDTDN
ncbi:Secreted protein Hcp [gamma proteobacterium IMCC2047]|nr:Secreted protein Hcp [gamma proteobacterium IMCC2047]